MYPVHRRCLLDTWRPLAVACLVWFSQAGDPVRERKRVLGHRIGEQTVIYFIVTREQWSGAPSGHTIH